MIDAKIALAIIHAQINSDAGKGLTGESPYLMDFAPAWRKYAYNPYKYKDELIIQAISLIRKNGRKSGFSYFLTNEFRDSYIVYFSFRIGGVKHQVSFHIPGHTTTSKQDSLLRKYDNGQHATNWVGDRKNASDYLNSRQACEYLLAHLYEEDLIK